MIRPRAAMPNDAGAALRARRLAFQRAWRAGLLVAVALLAGAPLPLAAEPAASTGFRAEAIGFPGAGVALEGSVLLPDRPGRKPGIVLVHGAGPGVRETVRAEAEAFASLGIVALVYDKRGDGYSLFERSFDALAGDALGAVAALRAHPEVDPAAVGLWGLSEGAWVAPLAANRSDDVAFVALVAATGVPPLQQTSWAMENGLRERGASGAMVDAAARTGLRLLDAAGGFPEARHDPVGPMERLRQPALLVYGADDRIQPAAESAAILQDALARGGNSQYVVRVFPGADHDVRVAAGDGASSRPLAPGYPELVAAWVDAVANGEAPGPDFDAPPPRARRSRPLPPLAWWESGPAQAAAWVLPTLAFATYAAGALLRAARSGRSGASATAPAAPRTRVAANWLVATGLPVALGLPLYVGYLLAASPAPLGPLIAGRTLPWLALQALAVAAAAATIALVAAWLPARGAMPARAWARVGVLAAVGAIFVAWAAYWGLLRP